MPDLIPLTESASHWYWEHKKTGGVYRVLGTAKVQTDKPLTDYMEVEVYQSEKDGSLWVRGVDEFRERFERCAPIDLVANSPLFYKTQAGESVAGIALRMLGNEDRWTEIAEMNSRRYPNMLGPDCYPVGTILAMPAKATL